jgi:hypothetical protein
VAFISDQMADTMKPPTGYGRASVGEHLAVPRPGGMGAIPLVSQHCIGLRRAEIAEAQRSFTCTTTDRCENVSYQRQCFTNPQIAIDEKNRLMNQIMGDETEAGAATRMREMAEASDANSAEKQTEVITMSRELQQGADSALKAFQDEQGAYAALEAAKKHLEDQRARSHAQRDQLKAALGPIGLAGLTKR